jgi:hypothetical protein
MESVSLFSEARNEYLKQLSTWIVPPLVEFFRKEHNRLLASEGRRTMAAFQDFCATVPKWNQDVIETHITDLLDTCRCDYVEELMTAVFIAHTKMLTAIRVNSKQKKLQITLPKLDHFLHRVFTECARAFWKAPFLFSDELTPIEKQKNILQAEAMCTEALSGAVRSLLPVKNILRDYLEADDAEDEEAEIVKPVRKSGGGKKKPIVEENSSDESSVDGTAELEELKEIVEAEESLDITNTSQDEKIANHPVVKALMSAPESTPVAKSSNKSEVSSTTAAPALTIIEKLETAPGPITLLESEHSVVTALPTDGVKLEKSNESPPPNLVIETEPTVHFTPYDTVYDETTHGISEIRYVEKVSVEDKQPSTWGMDVGGGDDENDVPVPITISVASESISLDDIEDLDKPAAAPVAAPLPTEEIEVEAPLGSTSDFEELT